MANTYSANFGTVKTKYAYVNSNLGLAGTGALTLETWVKLNSEPSDENYFFAQMEFSSGANTTNTAVYFIYTDSSGTKTLYFARDRNGVGGNSAQATVTAFGTSTWHHVVGTYDGTNLRLYLDGSLIAGPVSDTGTGTSPYADKLTINHYNTQGGKVLLDDFRVWSGARGATDIGNDYSSPAELNGDETNLVAYYKFNNDWLDTTANNYDLTTSGSPAFSSDVPFGAPTTTTSTSTSTTTSSTTSSTTTTSSSTTSTSSSSTTSTTSSTSSSTTSSNTTSSTSSTTSSSTSTTTSNTSSSSSTTSSSTSSSTTSNTSSSSTSSSTTSNTSSTTSSTSSTTSSTSSTTSSTSSTTSSTSSTSSTTSSSSSTSTSSSTSSTTSSSSTTSTSSSTSSTTSSSTSTSSTTTAPIIQIAPELRIVGYSPFN